MPKAAHMRAAPASLDPYSRLPLPMPQNAGKFSSTLVLHANGLKTHVQTVHEKRRDFACPHCAAVFGTSGSLKRHVQTVHEKRRDFECPHCAAVFRHSNSLKTHVQTKHVQTVHEKQGGVL